MELAAAELARCCADASPGAMERARHWLGWMRSDDFQCKPDDWSALGKSIGRAFGRGELPSLERLEVLGAAMERGRAMGARSFAEGRFIHRIFEGAWSIGGARPSSIALLLELEARRAAADAARRQAQADAMKAAGSRRRTAAPDLGAFDLSGPQVDASGVEPGTWDACCRRAEGSPAASWMWGAAWSACRTSAKSPPGEPEWNALGRAAASLSPSQAQAELDRITASWGSREGEAEAIARAGAALAGRGALWGAVPAPAPEPKRAKGAWGAPSRLWSPMQNALERGHGPVLAEALGAMGPSLFWLQAHGKCARLLDACADSRGVDELAAQALGLARTLAPLPGMPAGCARLILRAASTGAWRVQGASQADASDRIRECFALAGPFADLPKASPWIFPGFAAVGHDRIEFASAGHAATPRTAKDWAMDRRMRWGPSWHEFDSGRALSTGLGALVEALSKGGAPLAWPLGEAAGAGAHPAMAAMLEAWEIALDSAPAGSSGAKGSRL